MEFNPFSPEFKANPYPTYAELRENAPVTEAALARGVSAVTTMSRRC